MLLNVMLTTASILVIQRNTKSMIILLRTQEPFRLHPDFVSGEGDPSLNYSSQGFFRFFLLQWVFREFFLVFLEGLGWLRGSSMGVCEALRDMLAC